LSGPQWVARFQGSRLTRDLDPVFRIAVESFLAAIVAAGATLNISSTLRPKERAYLMHWAHQVYRNGVAPSSVPAMAGVHIQWDHPTLAASVSAAAAMVAAFGIGHLCAGVSPALNTLHATGAAIDMAIDWTGTLTIKRKDGSWADIASEPRTGMNPELHAVGLSYGVVKFVGGAKDKPHWSTTGH
jgi:hypothetical protein